MEYLPTFTHKFHTLDTFKKNPLRTNPPVPFTFKGWESNGKIWGESRPWFLAGMTQPFFYNHPLGCWMMWKSLDPSSLKSRKLTTEANLVCFFHYPPDSRFFPKEYGVWFLLGVVKSCFQSTLESHSEKEKGIEAPFASPKTKIAVHSIRPRIPQLAVSWCCNTIFLKARGACTTRRSCEVHATQRHGFGSLPPRGWHNAYSRPTNTYWNFKMCPYTSIPTALEVHT